MRPKLLSRPIIGGLGITNNVVPAVEKPGKPGYAREDFGKPNVPIAHHIGDVAQILIYPEESLLRRRDGNQRHFRREIEETGSFHIGARGPVQHVAVEVFKMAQQHAKAARISKRGQAKPG